MKVSVDYEKIKITEHLEVWTGVIVRGQPVPAVIHRPSLTIIRSWVGVVGLEDMDIKRAVDYANNIKDFAAINWETKNSDSLYPLPWNIFRKYLDRVGRGEATAEEVTAEIMSELLLEEK